MGGSGHLELDVEGGDGLLVLVVLLLAAAVGLAGLLPHQVRLQRAQPGRLLRQLRDAHLAPDGWMQVRKGSGAVSYTHLTLPTILLV
eukprot:1179380-Prorocentrum_minimum.AAC.1